MATTKRSSKPAAKKTAPEVEPELAARNRENAAARVAGKGSTDETHDANPDVSTDSSVRHAEPQTGHRPNEGHGGYPSGEYDVVPPAPNAAAKTKDAITGILEAHTENAGGDAAVKALIQRTKEKAKLSPDQFDAAVEAMPVGVIIEKEAPNRWRVHVPGQNRWGHGQTQSEAVESYVLGTAVETQQQAADETLAALPKKQQQEIADRDAKAAQAVGGTAPDTFARIENARAAQADASAALPAPNASTDGPEKASARDEAGRRASGTSKRK